MKKFVKVLFLGLVSAVMLSLAACSNSSSSSPAPTNPPESTPPASEPVEDTRNWTGFHGWLEEDWNAKDPSYQFTGYWVLEGADEYNMEFSFLMNLYSDGSAYVSQYAAQSFDYRYFGSWELVEDPDGDELHIDIREETNESGELIDHKYSYEVYEESDGGFSFGYDFGIAAGQFFRTVNMTGSSNIEYTTIDAFKAAADAGAFVTAMPATGGEEGDTDSTDEDTPAEDAIATYDANGLTLVLFEDGTMRVEFPAYNMVREGFTYEMSEDGTTLTVTGTPDEEAMGAFQQIWDGMGGETFTIDGNTATVAG